MSVPRILALATAAALVGMLQPVRVQAAGFEEAGGHDDPDGATIEVTASFRARGGAFYNFDLDRGLTPSGQALFPVPAEDPAGQTLGIGEVRVRTGLTALSPRGTLALKARVDLLDRWSSQASPEPIYDGRGPRAAGDSLEVSRVWAEAALPFGVFTAGRMGGHWGLGILSNDGDCLECDSADASDRIAFITPLAGHVWATAWDFASTSALDGNSARSGGAGFAEAVPSSTFTFAVLRWRNDLSRERRARAGKTTVDYGAFLSHRRRERSVPDGWAPAERRPLGADETLARGFTATALDGWVRLDFPSARIEAEAALVLARLDQPSVIPGVLLRQPVRSRQAGAALESEFGAPGARVRAGLDVGWASGDPAPGFGAYPSGAAPPAAGDLDGPQAGCAGAAEPCDFRVDNFRFHPDYHVDRILFREILGLVTDAVYLRPHVRIHLGRVGRDNVHGTLAVIGSRAVHAGSTPGGKAPLGIEVDPTIVWESHTGLRVALEHAVLFPLAGLQNRDRRDLPARPAHLFRVQVHYAFH